MIAENHHAVRVDVWMKRTTSGLPPERLLELFEQALGVLWRRAHVTLGEVTLMAIVDRVLHTTAEKFPLFTALKVESAGIRWVELHESAGALGESELTEGLRLVLVQFLTILGNLTAEILTPVLEAELMRVKPRGAPASGGDEKARPRARRPKETR